MVLCQSFRNPALLARMGATLQFLSGAPGRLEAAERKAKKAQAP